MIAHNLLSKDLDTKINRILPAMKEVEITAEYFSIDESNNCILYFPSNEKEENIRDGHKYSYYKIKGRLYDSIGTSKIKYWENQADVDRQLTMF